MRAQVGGASGFIVKSLSPERMIAVIDEVAAGRSGFGGGANYDVILTDYRLPGAYNGLDLVGQLESQAKRTLNCCIVTGDLDPAVIAAAAARGVPLIHKPLQPARLRALIAHLATETVGDRIRPARLS